MNIILTEIKPNLVYLVGNKSIYFNMVYINNYNILHSTKLYNFRLNLPTK